MINDSSSEARVPSKQASE